MLHTFAWQFHLQNLFLADVRGQQPLRTLRDTMWLIEVK
jgi:hypothetical protein